ncbi:hypothetical protein [Burkholderia sp. SCN-KJ]|uniref:hypothetical protein n=1 Tax=Burkholderia sp. SCN-KJ TaxID=2969248 RepID=UPI00214FBB83|nr:hypothetical protein [Burkholderia sp. SCN-KJ]MCR4466537.1 hypothetical protein [Burkholderia sp. SCN-KJ]
MNHSTLSHLTAEEQIKLAILMGVPGNAEFAKKYPEMMALSRVAANDGATKAKIARARIDGNIAKAITSARGMGMPNESVEAIVMDKALTPEAAAIKLGEVTKSAVAPLGNTTPNLVYPRQAQGVTPLVPVVTKPLVTMLAELGAPQLPPEVRVLTQAALLAASEVAEGQPYPAAAPGTDFALNGTRKFGLILAFSNVLLNADNDGNVVSFVQTNLENAANNAIDAAMVASLTAAAGAAQTTINAALEAFHGDLRTACWVGNPQTLAKLRSPQEQNIGPRGGTFYDLPALAVLAMPDGLLFLVDAQRTAVFDGPQIIERSNEADIVMDTAPNGSNATITRLFQTNQTAFKITRYADYKLMVNPVAVTVA